MGRATKTEALTSEEFIKRVDEKYGLRPDEWEDIRDSLFDKMVKGDSPIYEPKMNAYLEQTVCKYLHPTDDFLSLTGIARRLNSENPNYLIQSWLRSRNTTEFIGEWERKNNDNFDEEAFQKLLIDVRSPANTLTSKKWIESTHAIGLSSKRGKSGGTMAHPFIACDLEMCNDMEFRYEVLKRFDSS